MASTVVRVEAKTHAILRAWASEQKRPISKIVSDLVESQEAARFWKRMHEDFSRLRSDPVAWRGYQDEAALLEGGSMDGLENEEPYCTPEEEAAIADYARSQGW